MVIFFFHVYILYLCNAIHSVCCLYVIVFGPSLQEPVKYRFIQLKTSNNEQKEAEQYRKFAKNVIHRFIANIVQSSHVLCYLPCIFIFLCLNLLH